MFLCEKEWTAEVSSAALSTLTSEKMNKPQLLPLTEDIQKLNDYLRKESVRLHELLKTSPSSDCWSELAKVTLAATVLFNRRRGGEAERMGRTEYSQRNTNPLAVQNIAKCLTDTERLLCKMLSRVEIRGKRGRTVPVILTASLLSAIDLLNAKREECNIRESNPYIFSRMSSDAPIRASDCLRRFAVACGAVVPSNLTSTRLRKHIATVSQLFNLRKHEHDLLGGFLGHDIRVHRNFYRCLKTHCNWQKSVNFC